MTDKKEACPLHWPEGWIRTRLDQRKIQAQWKKSAVVYRDLLVKEFGRMGITSMVITANVPISANLIEPRDPGVAVWFSLKAKEDYSWQDALGIRNPDPTVEEINRAYRSLVQKHHPDTGGDIEMFKALTEHRDRAHAWAQRKEGIGHEKVIACDQFKYLRLNLCAIRLTVAAIRQIERCGTSSLLEKAWKGFAELPANVGGSGAIIA